MGTKVSLDTAASDDVDVLIADWLTLPEAAERLGSDVVHVRELLRARQLIAVRRGERRVLSIPAAFVSGGQVVKKLPGLLTLLSDAGYDENEALRWIFTTDPSLPGTPMAALTENRHTEVRRRAQSLAF